MPPAATKFTDGQKETSLLDTLIKPFAREAQRRREERAKNDLHYARRVERVLNEGRINFLLFGYGETHEPPATEKAIIGSLSIVSYDLLAGNAVIVSLTHDLRAPEIERFRSARGEQVGPVRIDQAFSVGGFDLMREVVEDATGFSIDFQIAFRDASVLNFVDQVFGEIEVDVPADFDTLPYYVDGKKYATTHFTRGKQKLNGAQTIQFMKALAVVYDKTLERNVRKVLVFQSLLDAVSRACNDRGFWFRPLKFLLGQSSSGAIAYDFDPLPLMVNNIGEILAGAGGFVSQSRSCEIGKSRIGKTIYVVDAGVGDGGVQWAAINAIYNPFTKKDMEEGLYGDEGFAFEVPLEGNARGDLVAEYWTSVRSLIKHNLLPASPRVDSVSEHMNSQRVDR